MNSVNNPLTYHDGSIPAEPKEILRAPPIGRWTKPWIEHAYDRKRIEGLALEDMQATVRMYERACEGGRGGMANKWLEDARRELAEFEAWLLRRANVAAE